MATYIARVRRGKSKMYDLTLLTNIRNVHDLFWALDEFANPFEYEVVKVTKPIGLSRWYKKIREDDFDVYEPQNKIIGSVATEAFSNSVYRADEVGAWMRIVDVDYLRDKYKLVPIKELK